MGEQPLWWVMSLFLAVVCGTAAGKLSSANLRFTIVLIPLMVVLVTFPGRQSGSGAIAVWLAYCVLVVMALGLAFIGGDRSKRSANNHRRNGRRWN